jgi:hypothetical protein
MSAELFDLETVAMLSPRLAWLKKHRIHTAHYPIFDGTQESPETGELLFPWIAWIERVRDELPGPRNTATGHTQDEAVTALAVKFSLPLWNEEAGA